MAHSDTIECRQSVAPLAAPWILHHECGAVGLRGIFIPAAYLVWRARREDDDVVEQAAHREREVLRVLRARIERHLRAHHGADDDARIPPEQWQFVEMVDKLIHGQQEK